MTLDEAIKHCEEVAYQKDMESGFETDNERYAMTDKERTACKECAEEHRQLAEWLKELKAYKEQEPCEDAVSRQAVLDVDFKRIVLTTAKPAETIIQKIQELPSVTPVRKKGKWIRVDHNKVKCSECEITHLIAQYPRATINYCPNCGAKMQAESEE